MTMFMTIGLPGSGKSTWAKSTGLPTVSSDELRAIYNLAPDDNTIFAEMDEKSIWFAEKGIDFVYDATNLKRRNRMKLLSQLKCINKVACFFPTPLSLCKLRNMSRDRMVPEEVIDQMMYGIDVPFESEGFDEIVIMPVPLVEVKDIERAYSENTNYNRLCKAVISDDVVVSYKGPYGTIIIDMYKTNLKSSLHTVLHDGSV